MVKPLHPHPLHPAAGHYAQLPPASLQLGKYLAKTAGSWYKSEILHTLVGGSDFTASGSVQSSRLACFFDATCWFQEVSSVSLDVAGLGCGPFWAAVWNLSTSFCTVRAHAFVGPSCRSFGRQIQSGPENSGRRSPCLLGWFMCSMISVVQEDASHPKGPSYP